MIEPIRLVGSRLALLLTGEDEHGGDDWVVFAGVVRQDGERLVLERNEGPFELRAEWIERIRPVKAELRDVLLDADYVLTLSVGNLPAGAPTDGFEATGLKWPQKDDS